MPVVERAFVISLPFRRDRIESFLSQVSGLACLPDVDVWPAIHGDTCQPPPNWTAGNGAWGCYRSHLAVLEYCLNNRISSYMVFEDDAQIRLKQFDQYVSAAFEELPDDWEQLYLGGQLVHEHSHPPFKISERLHRPFNVNRTHCFAVSRAGMLPIYQHICNLPYHDKEHIDHHLGRWHEDERSKVYCLSQWMVGQHGSASNVSGRNEPVEFYADAEQAALSHWLYESPVCVLFRGSPRLVNDCVDMLHFGNQINSGGYDVTLHEATKYRYPGPTLSKWFGWIRSEIVRSGELRLPAVYHPQISETLLKEHLPCELIVVDHVANKLEVIKQIRDQIQLCNVPSEEKQKWLKALEDAA